MICDQIFSHIFWNYYRQWGIIRILRVWIKWNNTWCVSSVFCYVSFWSFSGRNISSLTLNDIKSSLNISCLNLFGLFCIFFVAIDSHLTPLFLLPWDAVRAIKYTNDFLKYIYIWIHVWRVCSCWHHFLPPPPPQRTLLRLRSDHTQMFLPQEEIKLINSLILARKRVFFCKLMNYSVFSFVELVF